MKLLAAIGFIAAVAIGPSIDAAHADSCADFSDPKKPDRAAPDVFIVVARPKLEPACFLVPREVTDITLRKFYRDGKPLALAFQVEDLDRYLRGKASVLVGTDQRVVPMGALDCLGPPTPVSLVVLGARDSPVATIAAIRANGGYELETDVSGYHRFGAFADDFYFREISDDAEPSFFCFTENDKPMCNIVSQTDGLLLGARHPKEDMSRIDAETTRQCLQTIADLFRVPYAAGVQP